MSCLVNCTLRKKNLNNFLISIIHNKMCKMSSVTKNVSWHQHPHHLICTCKQPIKQRNLLIVFRESKKQNLAKMGEHNAKHFALYKSFILCVHVCVPQIPTLENRYTVKNDVEYLTSDLQKAMLPFTFVVKFMSRRWCIRKIFYITYKIQF